MKRMSSYSTIIGSLAGAVPPIIGYCAVSNQFDIVAYILWLVFSLWQIPHFYSIAILYLEDYQLACIPTLPIKKGIKITQYHIAIYIFSFMISIALLMLTQNMYSMFLYIIEVINVIWLYISLRKYDSYHNRSHWAKKMFMFSILSIVSLNILIFINSIIIG